MTLTQTNVSMCTRLTWRAELGKWFQELSKAELVLVADCLSTFCASNCNLESKHTFDEDFSTLRRLRHSSFFMKF